MTVKNDVLTSEAHLFTKGGKCAESTPQSACKFVLTIDGKEQIYEIEKAVATGYPCPHKGSRLQGEDWIVLKVKKPVDANVQPYRIPKTSELRIPDYTPITVVAKSARGQSREIDHQTPAALRRLPLEGRERVRQQHRTYPDRLRLESRGLGRTGGEHRSL